jgi:hypothetical protein
VIRAWLVLVAFPVAIILLAFAVYAATGRRQP